MLIEKGWVSGDEWYLRDDEPEASISYFEDDPSTRIDVLPAIVRTTEFVGIGDDGLDPSAYFHWQELRR